MSPGEIQETDPEETGYDDTVVKKGEVNEEPEDSPDVDKKPEEPQEIQKEENGLLEIYADGDPISITEDIMVAAVSSEEKEDLLYSEKSEWQITVYTMNRKEIYNEYRIITRQRCGDKDRAVTCASGSISGSGFAAFAPKAE